MRGFRTPVPSPRMEWGHQSAELPQGRALHPLAELSLRTPHLRGGDTASQGLMPRVAAWGRTEHKEREAQRCFRPFREPLQGTLPFLALATHQWSPWVCPPAGRWVLFPCTASHEAPGLLRAQASGL